MDIDVFACLFECLLIRLWIAANEAVKWTTEVNVRQRHIGKSILGFNYDSGSNIGIGF